MTAVSAAARTAVAQSPVDQDSDGRAARAAARHAAGLSGRPAAAAQRLQGRRFQLAQYRQLFASSVYVDVLLITLKISLLTTLLSVIAGYPIAYLISMVGKEKKATLLFWVLLVVLDQLPGARLRLDRAARPQRRRQPAAASRSASSIAPAEPALQLRQRAGRHGARADAAGRADHAVGDGEHRPQPAARGGHARRAARHRVLEDLFPAVAARRRGRARSWCSSPRSASSSCRRCSAAGARP